jgi:hypothetical protein
MNRVRLIAQIAAVLLAVTSSARAKQTPLSIPLERAGFERIHRAHGVTVYSHKESKALHFAAEARFAAPPAEVQKVLLAYERQAGQIGRLSEVRVLKRRPRSLVVYLRLNMPIIDDRDYTLQVRWNQRDNVRWIFFKASRHGPPPRKGVVRMTLNEGSWQLKPIRGGRTFARYQLKMDIAGWIPTWLVRRSAGKELPTVFVQFSQMLASARKRALRKGLPHSR